MEIIYVGTSPSGVTWNVYVGGKSAERVEKEIDIQRRRLTALWEKHERGQVRVPLSKTALDRIDDLYFNLVESDDPYLEDVRESTRGKTFLQGSRRLLRDIAEVLRERADAEAELASFDAETEREAQFVERSVLRSFATAVRKIERAVGEKATT